jgi:hypothetical protein
MILCKGAAGEAEPPDEVAQPEAKSESAHHKNTCLNMFS